MLLSIVGSGLKSHTIFAIFILLLCIALSGCSQAPPSSPSCRVDPDFIDRHEGIGACLVRIKDHLLTVRLDDSQVFDLAKGNLIAQERSQCAAHRHMWEQTGLNVEVAHLLGVDQVGLRIYSCSLGAGFDGSEQDMQPPSWAPSKVDSFQFIDPFVTHYDEWEADINLILLRDAFVAQGHTAIKTDAEIYRANYQIPKF